jgi:cyclopropane-fatty-acyl-phospholipid synthase
MSTKRIVSGLLGEIGVEVNGDKPWDIQVHDDRFYQRVLANRSIGLGETYMIGWWDCKDPEELFARIITSGLEQKVKSSWKIAYKHLKEKLFNVQTVKQTKELADTHYNLSNELFKNMLGKTMAYSCGYWRNARDLDEAQEAKLELICRKIDLKYSDHVLDIGCGWGSFIKYAAQKYGCSATGITIATEQVDYVKKICTGLPIEVLPSDYRELDLNRYKEKFDKVISVGMIEHVGHRNYRSFMEITQALLKPGGLFLLHTIGQHASSRYTIDPWLEKYIFPGAQLPSLQQLSGAIEGLFVAEDVHNFGYDYSRTLRAWHDNFEGYWKGADKNKVVSGFKGSPDIFYRMWRYYLLTCAALFRVRSLSVWQIVLAKGSVKGGYQSIR